MHTKIKEHFKNDIIDLFSQKKGGHVQKWLYNDHVRLDHSSGSKLWHSFVTSSKKYYLIQNEIDLIPALIKQIDHDYDTIIDFGLGNKRAVNNKTLPILISQRHLEKYIAIDVSDNSLLSGTKSIKDQFSHIDIIKINGDFYEEHVTEGYNKLGIFFGSTISNQNMMVGGGFPEQEIIRHLKTLGKTIKGDHKSSLIISFDANPDLKNAMSSYQHPSWVRMMSGLMHDVQDILIPSGDFNPTMWHYAPIIDKNNYVLHHIITPTIDQNFSIGDNEFFIKKGDLFVTINCFKYPIDLFYELLRKASFRPVHNPTTSREHAITIIQSHV